MLLTAFSATAVAWGGDPERPLLLRLADEKDPGHATARHEWDALAPSARLARLRDGLASPDPAVARVAALAADPDALSNDEIRRQMETIFRQPDVDVMWRWNTYEWSKASPIPASLGTVDIVHLWRALASLDQLEPGDDLGQIHRAMLPEHVEALVPLLETAGTSVFEALFGSLELVADHVGDDAHRGVLAKALLYGLARLRAERDGKPRPKLDSVEARIDGPGLPPAFVAIARSSWGLEESGLDVAPGKAAGLNTAAPLQWLHEWAKTLAPEAKDIPFLVEVLRSPRSPKTARAWCVRKLGAFDTVDAANAIAEAALAEDEAAAFAAAALVKKGKPERWRQLIQKDQETARLLEWEMDPEKARTRWLDALISGEAHEIPPGLGGERARAEAAQSWGVVVRDEDMRWIADRLVEPEVPPRNLVDFFTEVAPDFATSAAAARMAVALRDPPYNSEGWHATNWTIEPCAVIERQDPKVLLGLLTHWAETQKGDGHHLALMLLARLGDAGHVPAMLESWPEWDLDQPTLGRVHDPRVEAFLAGKVASADEDVALAALHALAIFRGVPELRHYEMWPSLPDAKAQVEERAKALAEVKRMVLSGDVIGATIAHGVTTEDLGFVKDPRALDRLRRLRRDRLDEGYPLYWSATAGLAIAGDEDATREYGGFLRDGRTWMLDSQQDETILFTRAHPEWIDFWVDRLESNCCTAFQAYVVLNNIYPTMPIDHVVSDGGLMKSIARKWLEKHRGSFVWSRILDAWVPK